MNRIRVEHLVGVILALGAGMIYWITLSVGPAPGEPARLLAQAANLNEPSTTMNPLWSMAMEFIAHAAPHKLAFFANLLSALCAALAVGMLYYFVAGVIEDVIEVDDQNWSHVRTAAACGGVAAALGLAFSIPFWYAATRAHPAAWHVLMLVTLATMFLGFARRPTVWRLALVALLAGIGVVDFTSLFFFMPLFAVGGLVILWRNEKLTWPMLAAAVLGFSIGLLFYGVAAWHFSGTTTYAVDGFTGVYQVVWGTLRTQYGLLTSSLPRLHWLVLVMATTLPWIIVLIAIRPGLNGAIDAGTIILHVILTATALAVFFDTRLAPWHLFGTRMFFLTPYVLVASGYGYLVAYWMLVPWHAWGLEEGWRRKAVPILAGVCAAALIIPLGVVAVRNLPEADGRPARLIERFCLAVMEDLGPRTWLVTDGALDDNLLIAASQQGKPLTILNITMGNNAAYMRRVALKFDNPRMKSLTQIGLVPMLQEWLRDDPAAAGATAVLNTPDLWYAAGITPLPHRTLYIGQTATSPTTARDLMALHTTAWSEWGAVLGTNTGDAVYLRRHLSMIANNLGVVMEDWQRRDDAWRAYAAARTLSAGNLSALLNQYVMVRNGYPAADKAAVLAATESIINDKTPRPNVWRLTRACGYVRMPEAFADLGVNWALSGQPGMAVANLRRAIDLSGADSDRFKRTLATLYAAQNLKEESATLLEEILKRSPDDPRALISLARLRARQNDLAGAEKLLKRAEAARVPKAALALEWATIYYLGGQRDRARIALQELVDLNPDNTPAWALLAMILIENSDERALDECYQALTRAKKLDYSGFVARGQIAFHRRKFDDARNDFEQALVMNPNNIVMLEQMLQLDVRIGRPDLAEQHVKQLIALDPSNAVGNYFMGSLQVRNEQYALAENSLRKSLESARTVMTLNDLAWVLHLREKYAEAEPFAREAVKMNPRFAAAHDTLGMILLGSGKVTDAEVELRKAIAISNDDATFKVHLVQALVRRKAWDKAREAIVPLLGRTSELNHRDRESLFQLRREADQGGT